MLFAFLPFLLIILMNALSGAPVKHYSMVRTATFPVEKITYRLKAPFFVNETFKKLSSTEQYGLMNEIDNEYYNFLYNECVKEHTRDRRMGKRDQQQGPWCSKFQEAKKKMAPGS